MLKQMKILVMISLLVGTVHATILRVPSRYATIQAGINAAADGDTVLVADGTYTGEDNKNIDFLGKAILVISERGPENCIIDCEGDGRGFHFQSDEDSTSILSGFKIMHGQLGASGIYCYHSHPMINNCIITENTATGQYAFGAGVYCVQSDAHFYNCIISNNRASGNRGRGGGIYCDYSNPEIFNCIITGNVVDSSNWADGGGIYCHDSNPYICNSIIANNTVSGEWGRGGGIYCNQSDPEIINCTITANFSTGNFGYGGGFFGWESCGLINNCTISHNRCAGTVAFGGGMYCVHNSNMTISNSKISGNITNCHYGIGGGCMGGGVYLELWSCPNINHCVINNNRVYDPTGGWGGGIYCDSGCHPVINQCTISRNYISEWTAPPLLVGAAGIGIHSGVGATVINSIIEGNLGGYGILIGEVSSLNSNLAYNDFFANDSGNIGGYLPQGLGHIVTVNANEDSCDLFSNIFLDPEFVYPTLNDYHLQWGSPCIEAGDPHPQYYDPDGTVADMGAFYFDQSLPVRILLSPHEIPYIIEPEGGTIDYTIRGDNIDSTAHFITIWCDVELPDSTLYGPVLGPVTLTIEPGQTIESIHTQTVPAAAPLGVYHYNAYAVVDQDTSKDNFMFGKLGAIAGGSDGWGNAGDMLIETGGGQVPALPIGQVFVENYPNPFNHTTAISYQVSAVSFVNLVVYDVSGRLVKTLVDGWRDADDHEVIFSASNLPSGIYIVRLEAGSFSSTRKIVLVK